MNQTTSKHQFEVPEPEDPQTPTDEVMGRHDAFSIIGILLPLMVLIAAGLVAAWLMKTAPQAKPRPPVSNAALVDVKAVLYGQQKAVVQAMGTVIPAREIELKPRVNGEVIHISENLLPGGLFRAGEMMIKIDPTDYELAERQLASEVVQSEADLAVEQGNQSIARNEYELLGQVISEEDRDLVLRKPQLESVKASLESTRAKWEKAKLDLARTTIKAPFNAVVKSRQVNVGAQVNESTPLVGLVGTDEYWIEVSVPTNQLQWIQIPRTDQETGSLVRVYDQAHWGEHLYRTGRVIRLAADLEEQGRMARLLVSVRDPLALDPENSDDPRLLIGSYVRLEVEGVELASVVALERGLLRDGNQVWIMDGDNRLDIRPVEIAFRGRDRVMISGGIAAGERLIVSRLAAPVPGMPLRARKTIQSADISSAASGDGKGNMP